MFNLKEKQASKKSYPIPEAGMAPARAVRFVEVGAHEGNYGLKDIVQVTFELGIDGFEYNGEVKPFWISHNNINLSSNPDATLTKWTSVLNPDAELLSDCLGKECFVNVVHNTQGDKTYANIGAVSPLMKGINAPELVNEPLYFSFTDPSLEVWEKLNDWEKKKIQSAENYLGSAVQSMLEGESPPVDMADKEEAAPY